MEKVCKRDTFFNYTSDSFSRLDESDDSNFYAHPRMVQHLDEKALKTVEKIIGTLIIEENPVILDLMASWDSHIPDSVKPSKVVGLGLNEEELKANKKLDEYVIQDINKDPRLPFPDETFDVVLNTVSVDYVTKPIELFREVGRILKPGGLFLVIFSNRYFPPKVVKIWREASEEERIFIVDDYFKLAGLFEPTKVYISKGRKRPVSDKYFHLNIPSDPIYAVYAEKIGGDPNRKKRPEISDPLEPIVKCSYQELKFWVKEHKKCPYCGEKLKKWEVPLTPFTEWDISYFYVCFNDECPYFTGGWYAMAKQGNYGISYRLRFNPENLNIDAMPVPHPQAFKENIVEE